MTTKSWRDVLLIHAAAELFPRMSPDELKALGEDIKTNGQQQPIAIIEKARRRPDGTLHVSDPPLQEVLDGISRLDAMEAAGIGSSARTACSTSKSRGLWSMQRSIPSPTSSAPISIDATSPPSKNAT